MTRKEVLNFILEIKEKEIPQGDEIYNLSDRERGQREGFNEAIELVREIIKREVGNNLE